MTSTVLVKKFVELLEKKGYVNVPSQDIVTRYEENTSLKKPSKYNILADANTPVDIVTNEDKTLEIIPRDFNTRDKRPRSNLKDLAKTSDQPEFDYKQQLDPYNSSVNFIKNEAPILDDVNFPQNEEKWIQVAPLGREIDYYDYILKNKRELCYTSKNEKTCETSKNCKWVNNKNLCVLNVRQDALVDFINKVAEELAQNELKAQEILKKGEYFVSDIVSYNVYTERPNEKIILTSNTNLDKILSEIFGKENIPQIGKRRDRFSVGQNYEQLNIDNPLKIFNNWYMQTIVQNNNTIFRSFANAYYWLMHPYDDVIMRNLGHYSPTQTNLANIYKSQVVDWLIKNGKKNNEKISQIMPYIKSKNIMDYATKMSKEIFTITDCLAELLILSNIYDTMVYVYNDVREIIYIMHPKLGVIFDHTKDKKINDQEFQNFKKIIHLEFSHISPSTIPNTINVLYPKK